MCDDIPTPSERSNLKNPAPETGQDQGENGSLATDLGQQRYRLRLYVAGATPRSMQALERIKLLCEAYLPGRYDLKIVDVYQFPATLQVDNVIAIPTLIKQLPLPFRQVVGDLSNTESVLKGLDIVPSSPQA